MMAMQDVAGNQAASHLVSVGATSPPLEGNGLPLVVQSVLRSGSGQPLDDATRSFMESRFNHDFSRVRIHTNAVAIESVEALNARAYTVGSNIVFGPGEYAPGTPNGQQLLSHELTHVIQQNETVGKQIRSINRNQSENLEREARSSTIPPVSSGSTAMLAIHGRLSAPVLQRQAKDDDQAIPIPSQAVMEAVTNSDKGSIDFPSAFGKKRMTDFGSEEAQQKAKQTVMSGFVASDKSLRQLVEETHWDSVESLRTFMNDYIAFAAENPNLKEKHQQAIRDRNLILKQISIARQMLFEKKIDKELGKIQIEDVTHLLRVPVPETVKARAAPGEVFLPVADFVVRLTPIVGQLIELTEIVSDQSLSLTTFGQELSFDESLMQGIFLAVSLIPLAGQIARSGVANTSEIVTRIARQSSRSEKEIIIQFNRLQRVGKNEPELGKALSRLKAGHPLTAKQSAIVNELFDLGRKAALPRPPAVPVKPLAAPAKPAVSKPSSAPLSPSQMQARESLEWLTKRARLGGYRGAPEGQKNALHMFRQALKQSGLSSDEQVKLLRKFEKNLLNPPDPPAMAKAAGMHEPQPGASSPKPPEIGKPQVKGGDPPTATAGKSSGSSKPEISSPSGGTTRPRPVQVEPKAQQQAVKQVQKQAGGKVIPIWRGAELYAENLVKNGAIKEIGKLDEVITGQIARKGTPPGAGKDLWGFRRGNPVPIEIKTRTSGTDIASVKERPSLGGTKQMSSVGDKADWLNWLRQNRQTAERLEKQGKLDKKWLDEADDGYIIKHAAKYFSHKGNRYVIIISEKGTADMTPELLEALKLTKASVIRLEYPK
jgi:hypothetical protein